jgi:hypothetical protein
MANSDQDKDRARKEIAEALQAITDATGPAEKSAAQAAHRSLVETWWAVLHS